MENKHNKLGDIPWEEVIFLAEDLAHDPRILKRARLLFPDDDIDTLKKIAEGLILRIWLNHGGVIPEKYGYRK